MRTIMRDFCNFRYVAEVLKAVRLPRCRCALAVCGLVLAGLPTARAQDLEFGFAAGMGSENTEFSHGVAVDSVGNVYMGGYCRGRADFDPGAGTAFVTSAGDADAYLQKLDSSGNLVWVKTFSGPENIFGYAVMVDNQGNAYLAGSFSGTADFDPGAGVTQFTASGSDAFIVKLSSSGALVWARKMGSADTEVVLGIAVDSSRNVYATGYFGSDGFTYRANDGGENAASALVSLAITQVVCGDGLIRGTEECDDHNNTSLDGCSMLCLVESGFVCNGEPSVCVPL